MFRPTKLSNLPDKRGLSQVKLEEMPLMFDAYINGSNNFFHEDALGEFWNIKISDTKLSKIRNVIKERVFVPPNEHNKWGDFDIKELEKISHEIRIGAFEF